MAIIKRLRKKNKKKVSKINSHLHQCLFPLTSLLYMEINYPSALMGQIVGISILAKVYLSHPCISSKIFKKKKFDTSLR